MKKLTFLLRAALPILLFDLQQAPRSPNENRFNPAHKLRTGRNQAHEGWCARADPSNLVGPLSRVRGSAVRPDRLLYETSMRGGF